jgi:hypothetical protein
MRGRPIVRDLKQIRFTLKDEPDKEIIHSWFFRFEAAALVLSCYPFPGAECHVSLDAIEKYTVEARTNV